MADSATLRRQSVIQCFESEGNMVPIIVLAAGESKRMGQPKQLLMLGGWTLIENIVRAAIDVNSGPVFVVLGSHSEQIRSVIEPLDANVVVNDNYANGIGSSIKAGLTAVIASHPEADGVVIVLCDQVAVTSEAIIHVVAPFLGGNRMVASRFAGTLGPPATFGREYFAELLAIPGDKGAKAVINQHLDTVAQVTLIGGDIDLDTPDDYARAVQSEA
jgi:molybdenum cofactor cytidylyltransferase